jgi:hypothetical protein
VFLSISKFVLAVEKIAKIIGFSGFTYLMRRIRAKVIIAPQKIPANLYRTFTLRTPYRYSKNERGACAHHLEARSILGLAA